MRLSALLAALLIAVSPALLAQSIDLTLRHADITDLSPGAVAAYEAAVESYDHADHIGALNSLATAAELSPDVVEIQLLFIDVARQHVSLRNMSWEEGTDMIHRVLTAYENILAQPQLPVWAYDLLEGEFEDLQALVDNLEEHYATRMEQSSEFIQHMAALRQREEEIYNQQVARLRAERERGRNQLDPFEPNPLFQAAAEARRAGGRREGVMSVSQSVRRSSTGSRRQGVTSVQ
jgi:hypothetical protein